MRSESPEPTIWTWLTRLAFAMAIVVVIARATMLEFLRDPFEALPGQEAVARGPGPSTSLVLDLLAATPALLVAVRAAFDRSFRLRRSWGNLVMLALGVWLVIGAYRADDRFAAVVGSAHLVAAMSLLWAMQQVVRNWRRLRLVAAVSFGILLVYLAHGMIDKFVELPTRQQFWERNSAEMLRNMNIEPGSFQAEQMRKKIGSGELLGLSASINTFGAMLVTLAVVAAGAAMHCAIRGGEPGIGVLAGIVIAFTFVVISWTDSRTALATPVLAGIALAGMALLGDWLRRHRKLVFGLGVAAFLAGSAVIVAVGLKTGGLFHDSMTFRWRYWVGSFHVWQEAPLLGVGFDDFQYHYLAHRLPAASEEVKDPHNFIVRTFAELGLIGGVLLLAWIGRALWDMTTPPLLPVPEPDRPPLGEEPSADLGRIAALCFGGMLLALIAGADWERPDWNLALDALKRLLYMCLLTIGLAVLSLRSLKEQSIDDRPAPWIRGGMTIAVLIYLVHNLIDFSMFEASSMFTAAMIAGTAWGVGLPEKPEPRPMSFARLAFVLAAMVAAFAAWTVPTILSESAAAEADDLVRANRPAEAVKLYQSAWEIWPQNADYAYRAARAMTLIPKMPETQFETMLQHAIDTNPRNGKYYLMRTKYELQRRQPRFDRLKADFEQALKLDPNAVPVRLDYAAQLERFGQPAEAKAQYELALRYNDGLETEDPRRLPAERVEAIRQKIASLQAGE